MKVFVLVSIVLGILALALCGCTTPTTPTPQPAPTTKVPDVPPAIPSQPASVPKVDPPASPTVSVAPSQVARPTQAPTPAQAEKATLAPTAAQPTSSAASQSKWVADGVISDGEYAHTTTLEGIRVWWRNDAKFVYLGYEAATSGWVGIGLSPDTRMKGANFLLAALINGQPKAWDAYGTAETGPNHPPDEELGGKNDIVGFAVVSKDGLTRFEVQIPLDSGDKYDKVLKPGETYTLIAAYGPTTDYNARHAFRITGQITLDKTP